MKATALTLLLLGALSASCDSKRSASEGSAEAASSGLVDLSSSLDPVRSAFNARKQQARFLTLLAPT